MLTFLRDWLRELWNISSKSLRRRWVRGGILRKKSMGSTLAGSLHDVAKLLVEISGPESPLLKTIDWRSWISSRLRAL